MYSRKRLRNTAIMMALRDRKSKMMINSMKVKLRMRKSLTK